MELKIFRAKYKWKKKIKHEVLPYSPTVSIRGSLTNDPLDCGPNKILIEKSTSFSDIYYDLALAKVNGCSGVLISDDVRVPSISLPYLQDGPTPPPLPIIIAKEVSLKRGSLIEIDVEVKNETTYCYTIHAIRNGGNKKILLISNHDTWLSRDDVKVMSSDLFTKINNNDNIQWEYISMSGIESGAPGYASLYWGYTARRLAHKLAYADLSIEIRSGRKSIQFSPGLKNGEFRGTLIDPFTISFELLKARIPSIVLNTDLNDNENISIVQHLAKLNYIFNTKHLIHDLLEDYQILPAEIKAMASNFIDVNEERPSLLKFVNRYLVLPGEVKYGLFHKSIAVRKSYKYKYTFAEGYPSMAINGTDSINKIFFSEMDKTITDTYIDELYAYLKEFL